jgi:hypothetical protein
MIEQRAKEPRNLYPVRFSVVVHPVCDDHIVYTVHLDGNSTLMTSEEFTKELTEALTAH